MNTKKRISMAPITLSRIPRVTLFVLVAVVLAVSVAVAAVTNSVTIQSHGVIGLREIVAASGSRADIQAAVNQMNAAGGGTVYIPAGTFNFNDETVSIPGGVNVIGAGIGVTILQQTKSAPFNEMFAISGQNGKPSRISGIEFRGLVTSSNDNVEGVGIVVWGAVDFRIDNNKFIDFPNIAISVGSANGVRGVIDHNIIDNPYKDVYGGNWGYGIVVSSDNYVDWDSDITHFLGKYETAPSNFPVVYIEDNTFSRTRHAIASNQRGWYVVRYNTFSNPYPRNFYIIDVHGASTDHYGGRGLEAYGNVIDGGNYPGSVAFGMRGGSGIIFDNLIRNSATGVRVIKDQPGNLIANLSDLYVWGNTYQNVGVQVESYSAEYQENVNYFLRAPSLQQDGFTYSPYSYPHPSTLVQNP